MSKHETAAYTPDSPQEPSVHAAVGHEYRDVSAPWTVFSAAVICAIIIGCSIVSRWMFGQLREPADMRSNTSPTGMGLLLPPEPRLEGIEMMSAAQQSNSIPLSALQAEQEQLKTYGWVNKDQQMVRIPIRRAMEIVVEKGLSGSKSSLARPQSALKTPAAEQSDRSLKGPRLSNPGNAFDENR